MAQAQISSSTSPLEPHDAQLLDAMLTDMRQQQPEYRPGPYWEAKTIMSAQSIYLNGYQDFRSARSNIGLSYADNPVIFNESLMSPRRKTVHQFFKKFFLTRDFIDGQVGMTQNLFSEVKRYQTYIAQTSPEVARLLEKYDLSHSCTFGCDTAVSVGTDNYPVLYLELCQQLDQVRKHIDLEKVTSVFEIGGGFGAMAHILMKNFPNIKTYVYLDIPPNLFIGTQYLKSQFPGRVHDYLALRDLDTIDTDAIKAPGEGPNIYCICPWQIEKVKGPFDLFYNSHSFVEMSEEIVANYAAKIESLSGPNTQYAFVTYDNGTDTSLEPHKLGNFFPFAAFNRFDVLKIFEPWRRNFFLMGRRSAPLSSL